MARLHVTPSLHGTRTERLADGPTISFEPFRVDHPHLDTIRMAMAIVDRIAAAEPPSEDCTAYFSSLPGGTTFAAVWARPGTWVSRARDLPEGKLVHVHANGCDIVVSDEALAGRCHWRVAAAICHELAHAIAPARTVRRRRWQAPGLDGLEGTLERLRRYFTEVYA